MQLELSIVVPLYNEAQSIVALVQETRGALRGRAFELLLVDDGSHDATLGEALRLCGESPQLRVLQHPRRYGQSAALYTGVAASRAAWVATLDGDCQSDPRDIGVLLAARDAAGDERVRLVMGNRTQRADGVWRRLQGKVANRVRARLLGDDTPDGACGIKLFARDTYLTLPRFDHMHRFLPVLFLRAGAHVISVAVRHRRRVAGTSKYGMLNRLGAGIVDLGGVMWLGRRHLSPRDVVELAPIRRDAEPLSASCASEVPPRPEADAAAQLQGAHAFVPAVLAPWPRE